MTNPDDLIRRGDVLALPHRLGPSLDAADGYFISASAIAAIPAVAAIQPADPVTNADSRQRVTVKPLVWEADEDGNYRAQSIRGGEGVDRMIEPQVIGDDRVFYEAWGIEAEFDTPEAAQAAIEAEIASEILAAIDVQQPTGGHFDDVAVRAFAKMMAEKMAVSRAKGRSGWNKPEQCSVEHLRHLLYEHLAKGDPVDVANICMMLRHYEASTAPDPRDAQIAALVGALEVTREIAHSMAHSEFDNVWDQSDFDSYTPAADAAIAAAKGGDA